MVWSGVLRRRSLIAVALSLVLISALLVGRESPAVASVPAGFADTTVITGRTNPTTVAFAPDGHILIAQKNGLIYNYASLADTAPVPVADLRSQVHDFWDRGLLGLAVPPDYPTDNHLYVLYAYDARIGGTAPTWNDACPNPPGATTDGCVISGRLSRLTLGADGVSTGEQVLINDWCQQFPSHSVGALTFGADRYLYVSGGEGASFNAADYGQFGGTTAGSTVNPCADPPGGAGTALAPPSAQGGSLRSQSVRRVNGPATLNGAVLRLDPATGLGAPGNPYAGSADVNKARVLAYGFRNPFRFTMRPGTRELWVADVGAGTWEEVDRVSDTAGSTAQNFGWPCYEGPAVQGAFQSAKLEACDGLYADPTLVTAPHYTYNHANAVVSSDGCATSAGSSITGVAFYPGGSYPAAYNGALFFADHSRRCIWAMLADATGQPSPTNIVPFSPAGNPVDLQVGPNNDLFYVDMEGGSLHRLSYTSGNQPPVARITASPTSGNVPLSVTFDGRGSSDPDGGTLSYAWSLGDGTTGTGATLSHTFTAVGTYPVTLKVTDAGGLSNSASTTITAGSDKPVIANLKVQISDPVTGAVLPTYRVGDTLKYSATATSSTGATLAASGFSWDLSIHHGDHTHPGQTTAGRTSGSFPAPDHSYPCFLTIALTVTDPSSGLQTTQSVNLNPTTVALTFKSNPGGLRISLGNDLAATATPFSITEVVRHQMSVSATSPQVIKSGTYSWQSWSDGGAVSHTLTVPSTATTYTATYRKK